MTQRALAAVVAYRAAAWLPAGSAAAGRRIGCCGRRDAARVMNSYLLFAAL